jgi:hypothetical protein
LLTLSATYFYDRFDQSPDYGRVLYAAWYLLIASALAGILAGLSTWKNLDRTDGFGPYLSICYAVSMWTFTLGFAALSFVLVANVGTPHKPDAGEVVGLFVLPDTLPAFEPASASPTDPRFVATTCAMRRRLIDIGASTALVVGRADQRELSNPARSRYATNFELAQRRAERIAAFLTDSTACTALPVRHVVALTSGWRHNLPTGVMGAAADELLAADRRVEVYGFEVKPPLPK